ncbi:BZ3500_MvSof-1268-A1-R1_Chr2-1g04432 [Microbotryum saponariae]|uniref:glutathione peroxidase n=1 Tax=Microbotryum saponariae TaxID=289078 RepID=A0A2X0KQP8_9BASI|nr:BZ3500_MvSof-1268-A1-R1_Chr2-1g04432 [Microbotryum saponariae]SCZ91684.1 BZ3501_MvSof-1269-A2-R1_Chr2-1g04088 [Microbotryum saponariae]
MPIALARRRTCLAFTLAIVAASLVLMALRPTLLNSSSRILSQSARNGAAQLSSAPRPKVVGAAADQLLKQQQQQPPPAAATAAPARAQPAAAPVGGAPLPPSRPFSNQAAAQAQRPAHPEPATPPQADNKMSVKQTVDKHIKDGHVVVFSKSYCPYCKATKQLLSQLDAKATVFELDQMEEGSDWQAYLGEKTGQRTVPSVWIDGDFIGGNSDVQSAHGSGKLQKLLKQ